MSESDDVALIDSDPDCDQLESAKTSKKFFTIIFGSSFGFLLLFLIIFGVVIEGNGPSPPPPMISTPTNVSMKELIRSTLELTEYSQRWVRVRK